MKRSKSLREFAVNIADTYKTNPFEVDRYIKVHNVCFKVGTSREQFNNDMELCITAGRIDLLEYVIGRDMHTAFALWAFYRKKSDIISEFFNKETTQAAITLLAMNSVKKPAA